MHDFGPGTLRIQAQTVSVTRFVYPLMVWAVYLPRTRGQAQTRPVKPDTVAHLDF
jgi:hypothetical protein